MKFFYFVALTLITTPYTGIYGATKTIKLNRAGDLTREQREGIEYAIFCENMISALNYSFKDIAGRPSTINLEDVFDYLQFVLHQKSYDLIDRLSPEKQNEIISHLPERCWAAAQTILDGHDRSQLLAQNPVLILTTDNHRYSVGIQKRANPTIQSLLVKLLRHEPRLVHVPARSYKTVKGEVTITRQHPLLRLIELYKSHSLNTAGHTSSIETRALIESYLFLLIENGALLNDTFTALDVARVADAHRAAEESPLMTKLILRYMEKERKYVCLEEDLKTVFANQNLVITIDPPKTASASDVLPTTKTVATFPITLVLDYCIVNVFRLPTHAKH